MACNKFQQVREEQDPISQARGATELINLYQQRGVELARLRKDAINRAALERGMTFSAIAQEIGLSKGRITQIRQATPRVERVLFGVGPITLAVPVREVSGRAGGVIALEDTTAAQQMTELLESLAFIVQPFHIPPGGQWTPPDDSVAICGPKTSSVTKAAIDSDPHFAFEPADKTWMLRDRSTGEVQKSPIDEGDPHRDIAYIGRTYYQGRSLFVVAGVHAIGSLGAVSHLVNHLSAIYELVGAEPFSMVISAHFDGINILETETVWEPRKHK